MTRSVTYCLKNVCVSRFVNWLLDYIKRRPPDPHTAGYLVLHPVELPSSNPPERPLTLDFTWAHVSESGEVTMQPPGYGVIRFDIVPLTPEEPKPYRRSIEVTAECNLPPAMDYFEGNLLEAIPGYFSVRVTKAATKRMAAIEARMGYESSLDLVVRTTLGDLHRCLLEFHSGQPEKGWMYDTAPTIGETRFTQLKVLTDGVSCLGRQIWYMKALDLPSHDDLGTLFCIISATPALGWTDDDVLSLNFWPDWNKGDTPLSYRDYLTELLDEFKHRGTIKRIPGWLEDGKRKRGGKHPGTATNVAKARLIMELKDKGQTVACNLVPVSPVTFREWRDDPDVLSEMERLRQDENFLEELKTI